ncbi:MAG: hypothetical protein ACFNQH_07170 [Veillonella parvula]
MKIQPINKIVKAFNRDKKRNQKHYWDRKKKPEPEEKFEDYIVELTEDDSKRH